MTNHKILICGAFAIQLFLTSQVMAREISGSGGFENLSVFCSDLANFQGTQNDAAPAILRCVDATPDNGVLELPPGKYFVAQQLHITKSLTLKTQGHDESTPQCNYIDDPSCAEIIARVELLGLHGMLFIDAPNVKMDHIVINGNKVSRQPASAGQRCKAGDNQYGMNVSVVSSNASITNSVSKNAVCGSGMQIILAPNIYFARNTITANGLHNSDSLWSDGVTVLGGDGGTYENNSMIENTDVDFIFFSCQNCNIHDNYIAHTTAFEASSFAAIMLGGGVPNFNGNFTGSNIYNNFVDCSTSHRCGFGLYIGNDAWLPANQGLPVIGGNVFNNEIHNAEQGFNVDHTSNLKVSNNSVTNSGGTFLTGCGQKRMGSYNIAPGSVVDLSDDQTPRSAYTNDNWDGCTPNWWTSSSGNPPPPPPPPNSVCNPVTQPAPTWGAKNGQCLRSCGALGGTQAFNEPCSQHGMSDAGASYDVQYCCK